MACYPCTHCNKCGMFDVVAQAVCAACGTPMPPGTMACPTCGCKKVKMVPAEKPGLVQQG